eukprot:2028005-Rhodomonas_salina.2
MIANEPARSASIFFCFAARLPRGVSLGLRGAGVGSKGRCMPSEHTTSASKTRRSSLSRLLPLFLLSFFLPCFLPCLLDRPFPLSPALSPPFSHFLSFARCFAWGILLTWRARSRGQVLTFFGRGREMPVSPP